MFTGQISKAFLTSSSSNEIFENPPKLRQKSNSPNSILSPIGTNGAPCPPKATSCDLKSQTTVMPVTAVISAPLPIEGQAGFRLMKTVCPCEAIRSGVKAVVEDKSICQFAKIPSIFIIELYEFLSAHRYGRA